jgi:hypothetical protein
MMLRRICGEFLEMPGLRLTLKQAQRLWGLDEQSCIRALRFLVEARFLTQINDGIYARLTEGVVVLPPLRMAKATRLSAGAPRSLKANRH